MDGKSLEEYYDNTTWYLKVDDAGEWVALLRGNASLLTVTSD
jgi:hypothetical protein